MEIPKKYRKARTPKQVLKPGVGKLSQAIQKTLNECNAVMSAKTIAAIIFVPRMSKIEYRRALNSLGAELRRGAFVGKWRKVERGLFCSNADSATESIVILDSNSNKLLEFPFVDVLDDNFPLLMFPCVEINAKTKRPYGLAKREFDVSDDFDKPMS